VDGTLVKLSQVVDLVEEPGQLELRRDDFRQDVAVTARLEGRDLGSAMARSAGFLARTGRFLRERSSMEAFTSNSRNLSVT